MMRQRPGSCGRRSNRDAYREPNPREALPHIADQSALAAEQMRNPADVEPQSIRSIYLDQRRPAARPFREPVQERFVSGGICWH
jgi:hypothetical protein